MTGEISCQSHVVDLVSIIILLTKKFSFLCFYPQLRLKLICLFGCGGNRDKGKRPIMAKSAYLLSTQLILTSDNPRDEEPYTILQDMAAGLTEEELRRVLIIEDRASAIKTACTLARQGDVILIAGKGHEDYQIIKGVKHHFDDHEVVKGCL